MKRGLVRIIAGKWRGKRLKIPDVPGLRPTPDRVRETLFNWLAPILPNAYCLDLFAGSGVLGFEALSRGAAGVVMIDNAAVVIACLKEESEALGAEALAIYQAHVPKELPKMRQPFDVVFLDPPYQANLLLPCCHYLEEHHYLASSAYIYLEAQQVIKDNDLPLHWRIIKSKKAGQVFYHLAYRDTKREHEMNNKPRLLSGDTPTGRLHLGHWVGSVENRVQMQDDYECYFLIANLQAFTTRWEKPEQVHQNVMDLIIDYLAVGIDPKKSTIFLQTEIAAIAELTLFFSMLVPFPRIMRNPTIKDEIRDKGLGDNYPFGFLLYPINQVADILAFRAQVVPVGEDQIPHLELGREVARRFNQLYCGVDSHTLDNDYVQKGGLFPIFDTKLGRARRLVGIGAPGADGHLLKMSKSLNNAIYLSDDADAIQKKVMSMYTDPKRLKPTDKGTIENNPLWIFHDTFNPDIAWVAAAKERYRNGTIGDVECKRQLIDILVAIIEPMRERRLQYEKDLHYVKSVLQEGTLRANEITNKTLLLAKEAMKQRYF